MTAISCVDRRDNRTNVVDDSRGAMMWWQGSSLLRAVSRLRPKPKLRQNDGPAVICFLDAFKIGGVGTVVCGLVLRGTLRAREGVTFLGVGSGGGTWLPNRATVRSIECFHEVIRTIFEICPASSKNLTQGFADRMLMRPPRVWLSASTS